MPFVVPPFAPSELADTARWAYWLGEEWRRDFIDGHPDGPPRWLDELTDWVASGSIEERNRASRVMRKLRRTAPREYEVAFRALVLGESFEEITAWLNERALRNGIPLQEGRDVHYRVKDAVAIFMCAVEFARALF